MQRAGKRGERREERGKKQKGKDFNGVEDQLRLSWNFFLLNLFFFHPTLFVRQSGSNILQILGTDWICAPSMLRCNAAGVLVVQRACSLRA